MATKKPVPSSVPERLKGSPLLDRVRLLQSKKVQPTPRELARSCGYLFAGTGKEQMAEFSQALLFASGVLISPSVKKEEIITEPLKVGSAGKIYRAKQFLIELGLNDGDSLEWRVRKTKTGPVGELIPVPRPPRQTSNDRVQTAGQQLEIDVVATEVNYSVDLLPRAASGRFVKARDLVAH